MKKIKIFYGILILSMILSCSSDDDSNNSDENFNGFNYNGTFYATPFAFVSDENTVNNTPSDISIILSNVDPFQTNQSTGVNFVSFDFEDVTIETGTITEFPDYRILENADLENFLIDGGNTILDDTKNGFMSTASSVTINSISQTNIDFDFTFTREDGEVISGNYAGSYTDTSD